MKLKSYHTNLFLVIFLFLAVLMTYGNIFDNELLWDDESFIVENPDIRSFSNIPKFFLNPDYGGLYRPLKSALMTLTYNIWGVNKFGYHLNSFLLHFLSASLVFYISLKITGKRMPSFLAALIFAVHPIHTERVTGATAGFDLLGIVFYLLSFFLYLKFRNENKSGFLYSSLLSFTASLLSSEEAVSLPFLILAYEAVFSNQAIKDVFRRSSLKKAFGKAAPYIAMLLIYLAARFLVLGQISRRAAYITGDFYSTMLTMPKVIVKYIYLLVFPLNLSLNDTMPFSLTLLDIKVIASLLIVFAVLFYAIYQFSRNKIASFAVFWLFITLIPFYNIVPITSLYAERYLYLPSLGICVLFSLFFLRLKRHTGLWAAVFVIVLLFFSARTISRNNDWQNAEKLWQKTISASPSYPAGYNNLGREYLGQKRYNESISLFLRAIELNPYYAEPYNNLGIIYKKSGNYTLAVYYYAKAISLKDDYYEAYYNLGILYNELGEYEKAAAGFLASIRIRPNYAKAHNNLGIALINLGRADEAISEFRKALFLNPSYMEARNNLEFAVNFKKKLSISNKP